jgi:hypothetical protein
MIRVRLELFAQPPDVDVHGAGIDVLVSTPGLVQELMPRPGATAVR